MEESKIDASKIDVNKIVDEAIQEELNKKVITENNEIVEVKTENKIIASEDISNPNDQIKELGKVIFDSSKSMEDVSNVITKVGLMQAFNEKKNVKRNEKIQKEKFFGEQETDKKLKDITHNVEIGTKIDEQQVVYYNNHKDVLVLMKMLAPHSLYHMKVVYWIGIWFYFIVQILHCFAQCLGEIIGLFNVFFSSAFGSKKYVGTDEKGKPIYTRESELNIATRVFLIFIITIFLIYVILAVVDLFTGFNLIEVVKNFTNKI